MVPVASAQEQWQDILRQPREAAADRPAEAEQNASEPPKTEDSGPKAHDEPVAPDFSILLKEIRAMMQDLERRECSSADALQELVAKLQKLTDEVQVLGRNLQAEEQRKTPGQRWRFVALRKLAGQIYALMESLPQRAGVDAPGAYSPRHYLLAEGDLMDDWTVVQIDAAAGILVLENLHNGNWIRLKPGQLWQN